jgi:hypothetical protein
MYLKVALEKLFKKRGIFFFSPLSLCLGMFGLVLYPQASSTVSRF